MVYRIAPNFRSSARRDNRRIVNSVTVVATQETDEKTSRTVFHLTEIALGSGQLGRRGPAMERRRRRQLPLQTSGAFPHFVLRLLAATDGLDDDVEEQQVAQAEDHAGNAGEDVELGEHHMIVDDTPRHPGQADEVLREEGDVEADDIDPEEDLGQPLVIHVSGPFGQPVEDARE